ncbi:TonB-dependent receptor [Pseudoxanthomonas winnipegensis]|uniref:TonB-dependent receptor n=1 Tax=Pseudoxanthomonas winnipegensis TaxID=2480810 RepID=UPI002577C68A|nr:TonB-dependent receptor [Pseudoxanthomonas winnipegensis]WJI17501.1 TonB-dependent receptor [Pseudoxanthomonas winnipegensis]
MHVRFRSTLATHALGLCIATILGTVHAQALEQSPPHALTAAYPFDLPRQPLAETLRAIARQAGANVLFDIQDVDGVNAPALQATLTAREAIDRVLAGSGLSAQQTTATTMVIRRSSDSSGRKPQASVGDGTSSATQRRTVDDGERTPVVNTPAPSTLDTIAVTGTRIKGGTVPSPVITVDSGRIREEGFSDMGEVIRSLPQNFSGGQNPGVVAGAEGGGIANQNISGGSSLNLRGLGPDATLTLLNGRRLAYSGFVQAVDISAIPVEAVDRLEVIPDGASAIYGSDAVGGVGNVILRRDYEGLTVLTRHAGATDGGLTTREYSATGGAAWANGGLIAAWKRTSADPIYADQRGYADHLFGPTTLYPESELDSGLLSLHQALGSRVELQVDTLRTKREQLTYYVALPTQFFPATAETTTRFVSPEITLALSGDWAMTLGGAWGKDESVSGLGIGVRTTGRVTPFARSLYRNRSRAYELSAEGPMFAMPGGDARLALGAGYRENTFLQGNLRSGAVITNGEDSSRFAYAEISLPLIGADQGVPGVQRVELTAAMRGEDYASFGGVATPKLGFLYDPSADFTLKASWGKSFKAPTLLQRYQPQSAYLYRAASLGGQGYASDATVLVPYGGNPDLQPERARTWSTSLAFHPEAVPALEAELSWYSISFAERIAQPLVYQAQALNNAAYAPFIDGTPTADEQATIITNAQFSNFTGAPYDPAKVVAIAYNRYVNTVAQRIKGLDLSGSYRVDIGRGKLAVHGAVSWIDSAQQATRADSTRDLSGTLFYPAKVRGRIGTVWRGGGLTASTFANYVSGVINKVDGSKTSSFTTFDATLRYAAGERLGLFPGLEFALSAMNLFNRAPPLYAPVTSNPPYDSTNYSAIGRFVSLSVSAHW